MIGSLNKVMLIGRLGDDPKLSYTQNNTAFARMRVATNERYKDQNGEWVEKTEWHTVKAWGRLAEVVQQNLRKGMLIYVEGSLTTNSYEDKDKVKRDVVEVKAIFVQALERFERDEAENARNAVVFNRRPDPAPVYQVNELSGDDPLPF
jgi:single-strand DNA-binding protein